MSDEPILTPEQQKIKEINEKRNKVAQEIQKILDDNQMDMRIAQNIVVVPRQ